MNYDDRFILVISGALLSYGESKIPSELSKYFVKGKITEIISLGGIYDRSL